MEDITYKEKLKHITTLILDFDGVLTDGTVILMPPNEFVRTMNVRDSYAIQHAVKTGLNIAVITGGNNAVVQERMNYLGVTDVYLRAANKMEVYTEYIRHKGITDGEVMYMGDDLPDYSVMKRVRLAVCPQDAVTEIKSVSDYVSPFKGGAGCVRDVIEQLLKLKGKWFQDEYTAL